MLKIPNFFPYFLHNYFISNVWKFQMLDHYHKTANIWPLSLIKPFFCSSLNRDKPRKTNIFLGNFIKLPFSTFLSCNLLPKFSTRHQPTLSTERKRCRGNLESCKKFRKNRARKLKTFAVDRRTQIFAKIARSLRDENRGRRKFGEFWREPELPRSK